MNKQDIKGHFRSGDVPTEAQFAEWIERCVIWIDDISELPDACAALSGTCYLVCGSAMARCERSEGGWEWVMKGSGGGTTSYPELTNKPRINGTTLSGNKSLSDIGAMPDFSELRTHTVLNDETLMVVGQGNDSFRTTLGVLKSYLAITPAVGGCRLPIGFRGEQDGANLDFETVHPFVPGTSALYLNGQRLHHGYDYTEVGSASFRMEKPPEANDRILFEAVAAENAQQ